MENNKKQIPNVKFFLPFGNLPAGKAGMSEGQMGQITINN
jgi:hypothetical protein